MPLVFTCCSREAAMFVDRATFCAWRVGQRKHKQEEGTARLTASAKTPRFSVAFGTFFLLLSSNTWKDESRWIVTNPDILFCCDSGVFEERKNATHRAQQSLTSSFSGARWVRWLPLSPGRGMPLWKWVLSPRTTTRRGVGPLRSRSGAGRGARASTSRAKPPGRVPASRCPRSWAGRTRTPSKAPRENLPRSSRTVSFRLSFRCRSSQMYSTF